MEIIDFKELGETISNSAFKSSLSPALYHESSAKLHDLQKPVTKPIVDNDSDDSDSGIFRVKRPSSLKAEKRNAKVAASKHSEQQVCKIVNQ
jgi:hypothetical protein